HPDRCRELLQRLQSAGITGLAVPHTRILPTTGQGTFPDLPEQGWLAFTSISAVEIFARELQSHGSALPVGLKVAAVGKLTAGSVERLLQVIPLVPQRPGGISLAASLAAASDPHSRPIVFWPCAYQVAVGFQENLVAAGFQVLRWPLYKTLLRPRAALLKDLLAVFPWQLALFTAPSAVSAHHASFPDPWRRRCLAIGNTTANALLQAGCPGTVLSIAVDPEDIFREIVTNLDQEDLPGQ
ncbi:MAG: uroporphyrinogen-III synthase, partial [Candidatus Delongbacteria bacterium]|nr:uroporphyrinogen-III synthase [Candidatus Delongbacteria bacterium]